MSTSTSPLMAPRWDLLEFPVSLRPIQIDFEGESREVPNANAIFREDTGETLDIATDRYKLLPHGDIFRPLHDIVQRLPEPYVLEEVETRVGDSGGFAVVEWKFDQQVEVIPGDIVSLSLLARNSLNRSASLRVELAATRLICANGMRGPGPSFRKEKRHQNSLDEKEVLEWLTLLLRRAPKAVEKWNSWAHTNIFPQRLEQFLTRDSLARNLIGKKAREGILESVLVRNRGERGSGAKGSTITLWEAYNGLTEYATHRVQTRKPDLLPARQEDLHRIALRFVEWAGRN